VKDLDSKDVHAFFERVANHRDTMRLANYHERVIERLVAGAVGVVVMNADTKRQSEVYVESSRWKGGRFGAGLQESFRHGHDGIDGLVALLLAATASSSARSLPDLCGPWVLWCPLIFLQRTCWWRCAA
jgi:hypothetical protein